MGLAHHKVFDTGIKAGGALRSSFTLKNLAASAWSEGLLGVEGVASIKAGLGISGIGDSIVGAWLGYGAMPWDEVSASAGIYLDAAGVRIKGPIVIDEIINGTAASAQSVPWSGIVNLPTLVYASQVGAPNGICPLGSNSLIPAQYLPSFVDDVLEYASLANFPTSGETGKLYTAIDTGRLYRWSGTVYVWVNSAASTADVALRLYTPRTINGVPFDGSGDITIPTTDSTKLPLSGGTLTGPLTLPNSTVLTGQVNGLRITKGTGSVDIGSRNTSYVHYESSTGYHYFYGTVHVQTDIGITSDRRLKDNLEPIQDALSKLKQLMGYTYERTDLNTARRYAGVIAQDVRAVLPEAVSVMDDGLMLVAHSGVQALMVNAMRELEARVSKIEELLNAR